MTKRRALDLFCGGGGATKGLQRAGFHVTGVDIKKQPRYCGDEFIQADAMEVPLDGYGFIWASPPCEHWSQCTPKKYRDNHDALIKATRERLLAQPAPFVIENVPSAAVELQRPLLLCGSMFGLRIRRHRFFEIHRFTLCELLPQCNHRTPPRFNHRHSSTHLRATVRIQRATMPRCERVGLDAAG